MKDEEEETLRVGVASSTLAMDLLPLHLKTRLQLPLCPHLLLGQAPEAMRPGSRLCLPCT